MNFKKKEKGSVLIVVSIMLAIIFAMIVVLIYANNSQDKESQRQIELKDKKDLNKTLKIKKKSIEKLDYVPSDKSVDIKYQYFSNLAEVLENKKIADVTFKERLKGSVKITFLNNSYLLIASFENLPDLKNGKFYNAWLTKEKDFSDILDLKKALKVSGLYTNAYSSEKDLTDYDIYILSIEDDNKTETPSSFQVLKGKIEKVKK